VGQALLSAAKENLPQLDLWTFQQNVQARQFYERRGFRAIEMMDGSGNDERVPDIRYRWIRD
jgi:putative acetyltransferase